jgi:hypothetical protein
MTGVSQLTLTAILHIVPDHSQEIFKERKPVETTLIVFVDSNQDMWVVQYRDSAGSMVTEVTGFPASTPSIVVCHKLLQDRPASRVFAKLS